MVLVGLMLLSTVVSATNISEVVYVDTGLDTDKDGKPDLMYVSVSRPQSSKKLSTLYSISPYALDGTDVDMHKVDSDLLPQDEKNLWKDFSYDESFF
jgi:X-Pro dipeptidyl-peptidase